MELIKNRPEITSLIKSVAEEQGIKNHVITQVTTNEKGEGFLGEIFMITLKDPSNEKQLELVVKAAFTDDKVRQFLPIKQNFVNEICFYTEIYPAFKKLEEECGVSNKFTCVPKCFKVSSEDGKELLCLENLKSSNFELFDKTVVMDDEHISFIFKKYGHFHALSYALKNQKPEEYGKITNKLYDIHLSFIEGMLAQHFVQISASLEPYLVPGQDDVIIEKFRKYTGNGIVEIYKDLVTKEYDYSALLHGDCWSNNMMFKYENSDNTKKLVDMRLIDFQVVRTGNPIFDLSYCLYSGASKEIFDNLDKYLRIYYDSFSSFLRELKGDPKNFSFETFKDHWKKYSKFGFLMAASLIRTKLTKKESIPDFSDMPGDHADLQKFVERLQFDEETYRNRIRNLMYHMSEIDAL